MITAEMFQVGRARPSDAEAIAEFVSEATRGRVSVDKQKVMDRFGAKGLWLVRQTEGSKEGSIVGLAGWRAENLIAHIDDFLVFPASLYDSAGEVLIGSIEQAAQELQCEVSMFFVPLRAASSLVAFYERCGYERVAPEGLPRVWQESIKEAAEQGRFVMLKQLRQDLVLRPI